MMTIQNFTYQGDDDGDGHDLNLTHRMVLF